MRRGASRQRCSRQPDLAGPPGRSGRTGSSGVGGRSGTGGSSTGRLGGWTGGSCGGASGTVGTRVSTVSSTVETTAASGSCSAVAEAAEAVDGAVGGAVVTVAGAVADAAGEATATGADGGGVPEPAPTAGVTCARERVPGTAPTRSVGALGASFEAATLVGACAISSAGRAAVMPAVVDTAPAARSATAFATAPVPTAAPPPPTRDATWPCSGIGKSVRSARRRARLRRASRWQSAHPRRCARRPGFSASGSRPSSSSESACSAAPHASAPSSCSRSDRRARKSSVSTADTLSRSSRAISVYGRPSSSRITSACRCVGTSSSRARRISAGLHRAGSSSGVTSIASSKPTSWTRPRRDTNRRHSLRAIRRSQWRGSRTRWPRRSAP